MDAADDPLIGTLVDGRYQVHRRLAVRDTCRMFLAEHVDAQKMVALLVNSGIASDEAARVREFGAKAFRVFHDNVFATQDFGVLPSGEGFLVTEVPSGVTIEQLMRKHRLDPSSACYIAAQIAFGLKALHAQQLSYRFLTPASIYLLGSPSRRDAVKILLDFALILHNGDKEPNQGRPHYLAPEQLSDGKIDGKLVDQYALGCILYEMLTGEPPVDGSSAADIATQHSIEGPLPLWGAAESAIPQAVRAVVERLLAKDPRRRGDSMEEIAYALERAAGKTPGGAMIRVASAGMSPAAHPSVAQEPTDADIDKLFGPDEDDPRNATPSPTAAKSDPSARPVDPIEAAFAQLERGWIGVDAPRRMTLGQSVKVNAVAIRDRMLRQRLEAEIEHAAPRFEETSLGRLLRIELVPDQAEEFTVVPLSDLEQPVLRDEVTRWEWAVTPRVIGVRRVLRLRATNCVDVAGKSLRKSHPVRTLEVEVVVLADGELATGPAELGGARLRQLLDRLLPTDSEVEAFILDYFPLVFRQIGSGMGTMQKLTVLLGQASGAEITRRLWEQSPSDVERFVAEPPPGPPLSELAAAAAAPSRPLPVPAPPVPPLPVLALPLELPPAPPAVAAPPPPSRIVGGVRLLLGVLAVSVAGLLLYLLLRGRS